MLSKLVEKAVGPLFPRSWPYYFSLGDLDEDGDPDMVLNHFADPYPPFFPGGILVLSNLRLQLLPLGNLVLGKANRLEFYSSRAPAWFLPFVATKKARIQVAGIGLLQLDPAQAFSLGPLYLAQGNRLDVPFVMPKDQRLLGLSLSFQAAVFDPRGGRYLGFTNAWTLKVR